MFPRTETLSAWLDIDSRCYPPMTSWYYTAVAQTISPYRLPTCNDHCLHSTAHGQAEARADLAAVFPRRGDIIIPR